MNAVSKAYHPNRDDFTQLDRDNPALIGHGSSVQPINPVKDMEEMQQALSLRKYDDLVKSVKWNDAQVKFIKATQYAPGGKLICLGLDESGKTTLALHVAKFYNKLGFDVIWISPRNSSLSYLGESLQKIWTCGL